MATKTQKLFARLLRTENKHERKILKRKLKGVKTSEVSYGQRGNRRTVHGNIPWTTPNDRKRKAPKPKPKPPRPKNRRKQSTAQHSDPGTGPRRKGWKPFPPKPRKKTFLEFLRQESDDHQRSDIKHNRRKR